MKRFLAFLTLFALTANLVTPAFAGWHTEELQWHISRIGGFDGTSIVQKDTAFTVVNGASVLDTTSAFSLDKADQMLRGMLNSGGAGAGAAVSDTVNAGFLIIQPDSGGVPVVANGTFIFIIDGKVGGATTNAATNARGWARCDSVNVTLGAVADEGLVIPIRSMGKYNSPYAFPTLRARTIGGTGTISSARVFFRFWRNDGGSQSGRP